MDIYKILQGIFEDVFDDDSIAVTEELNAESVEDWDSLAQIRLIEAAESEFGITFDLEELAKTRNVGEMVKIIERKLE